MTQLQGGQSIQLVGTIQRPRAVVATTASKPTLKARSVINNQRHTLKVTPANTVVRAADVSGTSGQVLTLSPHSQIQIQTLQKQALQLQQFPATQPAAIAVKHQRRRSTAYNK
ncbi:transcription coregulator activity protein [Homalodisca vitripennis]|nr:transcription coregulator activity protein [Homalodisca vitripennis]